ncbi:MAG TPA: hypothetical protein VF021_03925, partial [Longimicrobiales bacterium]
MHATIQTLADSAASSVVGGAMPWDVVTRITSPLMLLALVVVAWYAWRTQVTRAETERLQQVPEEHRHELAEKLADKYGVPVQDLPPAARVDIVRKELAVRREHQRRISWQVFGAFVVTAVMWLGGFVLTRRSEDGESLAAGGRAAARQDSMVLRRADQSIPFPGTICLGNPALPPSDGCVALLGGSRTRQDLIFDVGPLPTNARMVDAVLHLAGLADNSPATKPTCLAASLDDKPVSDPVPLSLDAMTIGDRLSDESELNSVVMQFTKSARKVLQASGRHRLTISIPASCVKPGLVAFRDAQLSV